LIDEFVLSRPAFQCLTLIFTTRDSKKSDDALRRLEKHIAHRWKQLDTSLKHRVFLQPEQLDLTSLRAVHRLSARLLEVLPRLDSIICNAGIGGCTGLNWPQAIWAVCTDLVHAVSYPHYRLTTVGTTTPSQSISKRPSLDDGGSIEEEHPLGQVFTSNVFGHYVLAHNLLPLLLASPDQGRIILESSIEPTAAHFSTDDLQGLNTEKAYESSKRLSDILALTSTLTSTKPFVQRFISPSSPQAPQSISLLDNETPQPTPPDSTPSTPPHLITLSDNEYHPPTNSSPKIYLCHPGICATGFIPLPVILYYTMLAVMHTARWLGSPWHTVSAYKGACAPVWLALIDQDEIDDMEQRDGKGKWGSAVDTMGHEKVMRTVVEGWGLGGRLGEGELKGRKGTRRGFVEVTNGDREDFEGLGRECWRQMEGLRVAWEERMRDVDGTE
jgi:3-keto steroid reductase